MIVDLHKYLICGSREEMDRFFSLAQRAGFMEFIGPSNRRALELPDDAKTLIHAIKIARAHAAHPHETFQTPVSSVELAHKVIALHEEHENLLEELRMNNAEIARIAAFGDFSRPELDKLEHEGKRVFQFFCMKSDLANKTTLSPELIYVGTEYDLSYFVAINKERAQYPKMVEITIEKPVGELRERQHQLRVEIAKTELEIHDFGRALPYLQSGLIEILNHYHLELAKHDASSQLNKSLFAIEAWVPKTKIKAMDGLLSGLDVFIEEISIEPKDRVPTYQENRGIGKIGEDLVRVYDTPASMDKDPSPWIILFFAFFFAIIVADAGYGLVYFSIGLFLKWKNKNASGALKRFIKLILIASTTCIIWGTITASFFGIEIGPNNPFRRVSFLHYMATKKAEYVMEKKDAVYQEYLKQFPEIATATDGHDFLVKASHEVEGKMKYDALTDFYDDILLEFSLFVGMIHISLSFLRYMTRNWTGLGWIFFMIGGYLYFPSFLDATSFLNFMHIISKPLAYAVGKQMLYAGLILVFIISLLQKKKWGALHELTNAVQVFADVLSYLRLYALALAGMIMAATFNELGMKVGLLKGGIFIIILGHIVNLTLTIMSGVIHGLRLNFLEWYHYSFEGGGRLFDPLRIRKFK